MKTKFQKTKIPRRQKKEIKKMIETKMGVEIKNLKKTQISKRFFVFYDQQEEHEPSLVFHEILAQEATTNYLFGSIEIDKKSIFFLVDIDETLSITGEDTIMPNTSTKKIYVKLI